MDEFIKLVSEQIERKAKLYDGINQNRTIDEWLRFALEELGEVSSAITRHRYELAKAECIDVAHSALLLYLAIDKNQKEGIRELVNSNTPTRKERKPND